ncbi:actin maturation protease-like isoform X1 [Tigriopus californicus]|nr:actin maturation protease-like isoform X1 [Tigriopus californicus]
MIQPAQAPPPPPPPTPPPPIFASLPSQVSKFSSTTRAKKLSPYELQQSASKNAKSFDEQVAEACQMLKPVLELDGNLLQPRTHHYVYCSSRHAHGLLQDGPQCGLVALTMAMTALNPSGIISTLTILDKARSKGVTKHGEMFSAQALADLANDFCTLAKAKEETIAMVDSSDILNNPVELMNFFIADEKSLLLVPYDSDFNQHPCVKEGKRAHWAILLGFVLTASADKETESIDCQQINENVSLLNNGAVNANFWAKSESSELKVLARQGKSLRLFLFDPRTLWTSNYNLKAWEPTQEDERHYVLPDGGISEGLKGKLVKLMLKARNK